MKTIYPEFSGSVAFYAVGFGRSEPIGRLDKFAQDQGYPWPVALPQGKMLQDLGVRIQSFKVAFDGQGTQVYRDGFGGGDAEEWRGVMAGLAQQQ